MRESIRQFWLKVVAFGLLTAFTPGAAPAQTCGDGSVSRCIGDCNGNGGVTVDEIMIMTGSALLGGAGNCVAGDFDDNAVITVDEIGRAIYNALNGCDGTAAVDPGEECDDGGYCVGGADAGDPCTSEGDCEGDGACFGGLDDLRGCRGDDDCREGTCRKCRPYGGDGCAANCTLESDHDYVLVPGSIAATADMITFGTSGAVIFGPFLTVPLPLTGSQILTAGRIVNGQSTVVLKASGVALDPIPVSSIACGCIRGGPASTCGGTLADADGNRSPNCTPGFRGIVECSPDKRCAPIHGPGNIGSGVITCGGAHVDVDVSQDCNSRPGGPPFDPIIVVKRAPSPVPTDQGAGYMVITSAIGIVVGGCSGSTAEYGPDGAFCTDDDPIANRGMPTSIVVTTGPARGAIIPAWIPFEDAGAFGTMGAPFSCNGDAVSVHGANLAGAFTSCDQPTVSDIAVVVNFVAE